ncbi:tellurite resistance TerB family protein [Labrys wisconsinensis]|uniref:Uncharacterized membrane protein YebE (DUF533 family) n=1 Tax=Labrys wisconsinensis TaxID=425677 RepID=A0ABU0JNU8_9HYPH|nr:DUF533 domain-containing protein [Labrys wisconsinensis]MDQ0475063.1 uncharacterized membrane protein YebE (DUF533 family) [Labrys wisconsinensis]
MLDLNNLLGRVLNAGGQILDTPGKKMAAGGAAAGLLFTETGRDLAGEALKYGGIAALGGLALHAWQRHQSQLAGGPVPASASGTSFLPAGAGANGGGFLSGLLGGPDAAAPQSATASPPQAVAASPPQAVAASPPQAVEPQPRARLLIAAMVNAAKADGAVDGEEQTAILGQADSLSLSDEERSFLFAEFGKPFDMEPIVRTATTPDLAAEVYAASAVAVGTPSPAETAYLKALASRLQLPEGVTAEIQRAIAARA